MVKSHPKSQVLGFDFYGSRKKKPIQNDRKLREKQPKWEKIPIFCIFLTKNRPFQWFSACKMGHFHIYCG